MALKVAADRFARAFGIGDGSGEFPLAGLFVTQDVGSHDAPVSEVRGELYLPNLAFKAVWKPAEFAIDFMNMDSDIVKAGLDWMGTSPTQTIGPGSAAGFLQQILAHVPPKSDPCALPPEPAAVAGAYRLADGGV